MLGKRVETACLTTIWRSGVNVVGKFESFGLNAARGGDIKYRSVEADGKG